VDKLKMQMAGTLVLILLACSWAGEKAPLKLAQSTPLPELKEGDFDHFAVDLSGNRLFSTAEENSKVLVFDLKTNKLIHTIDDLKAPHSMLYRADLKKLFVVDGDLGEVKIYDTDSYRPAGSIPVREGADSSAYDAQSKYLYVVETGRDAHRADSYIAILDTSQAKQVSEIKINSDDVEAMALEKSGSRIFVDIRGKNEVEVYDRKTHALLARWPTAEQARKPTTIALDETDHRVFVGTRDPGKFVVLDAETGKIVTSAPGPAMVDDMAYDPKEKRIYLAGSEFIDVFEQRDPDHYERIGHIATAFRAKTAILIPQLNRYYLAVPRHEKQMAELRVYSVID
jgi:WD40 repeat protein